MSLWRIPFPSSGVDVQQRQSDQGDTEFADMQESNPYGFKEIGHTFGLETKKG